MDSSTSPVSRSQKPNAVYRNSPALGPLNRTRGTIEEKSPLAAVLFESSASHGSLAWGMALVRLLVSLTFAYTWHKDVAVHTPVANGVCGLLLLALNGAGVMMAHSPSRVCAARSVVLLTGGDLLLAGAVVMLTGGLRSLFLPFLFYPIAESTLLLPIWGGDSGGRDCDISRRGSYGAASGSENAG